MSILDNLNENQRKAAEKIDGPILILAGAGSGKTRTVTYKIAYMIKEKNINPNNILALTFTNKAANEMKERAINLIGKEYENMIVISTFHSFALKLLRKYATLIGYKLNFNIYDIDDQKKLMNKILKENKLDHKYKSVDILTKISKYKENLKTPKIVREESDGFLYLEDILKCYEIYQTELLKNNAMDFSDLLLNTYKLLLIEEVLKEVQERYIYIIVDEYQDTNSIQYKIVNKIADKYKNICVVGDEDQSIYKFRGADIKNILDFEEDYKEAYVVKLEQNYRSTQSILNIANSVIKNNTTSKGKTLYSLLEKGSNVKIYKAIDSYDEARFVVDKLLEIKERNNLEFSDFTILYRKNSQSRVLEEKLRQSKVPHKVFGGIQFYQRKEIKTILSYMKLLNNPEDNISFLYVIDFPKRGIGPKKIESIVKYATDQNISLFEAFLEMDFTGKSSIEINKLKEMYKYLFENELSVVEIAEYIVKNIDLVNQFDEVEREDRSKNINELLAGIGFYLNTVENPSLEDYISSIALYSTTDDMTDGNYVKLMTVHNSKGLEFKNVFIVGMSEGTFPIVKEETIDEIEEERRLAYVAITRAEKNLYITFPSKEYDFKKGEYILNKQSRFINEMDSDYLEYVNNRNHYNNYGSNISNISLESFIPFKKENKESLENKNYKFKVGDRVEHSKFGIGKVKDINDKIVLVGFVYGDKKISTILSEKVLKKL